MKIIDPESKAKALARVDKKIKVLKDNTLDLTSPIANPREWITNWMEEMSDEVVTNLAVSCLIFFDDRRSSPIVADFDFSLDLFIF
jgi:hypothetical protein